MEIRKLMAPKQVPKMPVEVEVQVQHPASLGMVIYMMHVYFPFVPKIFQGFKVNVNVHQVCWQWMISGFTWIWKLACMWSGCWICKMAAQNASQVLARSLNYASQAAKTSGTWRFVV